MKIAYFTQVNLFRQTGIRSKHLMQAEAWEKLGHQVCFFSVPNSIEKDEGLERAPFPVFEYKRSSFISWVPKLSILLQKISSVSKVAKDLDQYDPDIVYMRSLLWYPGLGKILKNRKVILEGNTLFRNELQVSGSFYSRLFNTIGESKICSQISGVVGVTNEITEYYLKQNDKIQGTTIGNGYLLDNIKSLNGLEIPPKNEKPQMIFVGSPGMPWHGINHFFEMAQLLPDFDFHLVGPKIDQGLKLPNLIQHGYMGKDELFKLYHSIDIAVGSLALYKIGMSEGSTLKVKEYTAFGIPTIVNHIDIDLHGQEFILELPSRENFVRENLEQIKNFVQKWKGKRVGLKQTKPLIDYIIKERQRLEFLKRISETKKK